MDKLDYWTRIHSDSAQGKYLQYHYPTSQRTVCAATICYGCMVEFGGFDCHHKTGIKDGKPIRQSMFVRAQHRKGITTKLNLAPKETKLCEL